MEWKIVQKILIDELIFWNNLSNYIFSICSEHIFDCFSSYESRFECVIIRNIGKLLRWSDGNAFYDFNQTLLGRIFHWLNIWKLVGGSIANRHSFDVFSRRTRSWQLSGIDKCLYYPWEFYSDFQNIDGNSAVMKHFPINIMYIFTMYILNSSASLELLRIISCKHCFSQFFFCEIFIEYLPHMGTLLVSWRMKNVYTYLFYSI